MEKFHMSIKAHSVESVEYADCTSAEGCSPNKCPDMTISFDSEVNIPEIQEMLRAPLFLLFPVPLCPGGIVPIRVRSMV